jgi:8-oxo-dGTP diphosphatase
MIRSVPNLAFDHFKAEASSHAGTDPRADGDPRPVVGVQAAVFNDDGILLQCRRNVFGDGCWGLPGGHLEFGESFEEAAARELEEETGLQATDLRTVIPHNTAYELTHYVQIAVEVVSWEGNPAIREPDRCSGLEFFDRYTLPEPLFEPSRAILDHLFNRKGNEPDHRLRIELVGDGHWTSLKLHGSSHPLVVMQSRSREEGWRLRSRSNTGPDLKTSLGWIKRQLHRRLAHGDQVKICDGDLPLDRVLGLFPPEHPVGLRSIGPRESAELNIDQLVFFVESELR